MIFEKMEIVFYCRPTKFQDQRKRANRLNLEAFLMGFKNTPYLEVVFFNFNYSTNLF